MRVDVVMPQMGESIAEGTITRWIKQVGDTVERDDPVFEISTDKVDAEIPSPTSGTLVEIRGQEGETVAINTVIAVIETDGATASDGPAANAGAPSRPTQASTAPGPSAAPTAPTPSAPVPASSTPGRFVSPVVKKIAAEHGIDPARIPGTGAAGRVTKKDITRFIEQGGVAAAATTPATTPTARPTPASAVAAPRFEPGATEKREKMTRMREVIAAHMISSRQTSAHVQSVFEVDMSHIVALRNKFKPIYAERHGTKLTFTPFFIKAACDALKAWPVVNASIDGKEIVYKKALNVGIAVALDWGLIVPVIRNADELSLVGLSKRTMDLGQRARTKQLNPDEVQDGTFTITNPGQFGGLFGLPIINQPQVAIMGIGGIKKRPVVINDAIAIRSMMYLTMSYDHRLVDGAVADQFLAMVQHSLETFDESLL
jgi:pyruvate dehydrogenase E2 component (dihydrolipoamide acetyltransferase)